MKHVPKTCACDKTRCPVCNGLTICTVCGGAEGELLLVCPGVKLTSEEHEANYAGRGVMNVLLGPGGRYGEHAAVLPDVGARR